MRRRRARNWAMLVVLLALCALFYAITIVKMTRMTLSCDEPATSNRGQFAHA